MAQGGKTPMLRHLLARAVNASLRVLPALLLAAASPSLPAAAPDRAAMFRTIHAGTECATAALSPDGNLLAAIFRTSAGVSLRVVDLETEGAKLNLSLATAEDGFSGGDQIIWLGAARLLVQVNRRDIVAVDADGKNLTRIVDWREKLWFDDASVLNFPLDLRIAALPPDEPDFVVIAGYSLGRHLLRRVHLTTGKVEATQVVDGGGIMIYDERGTPRVRATDFRERIGYELLTTEGKKTRWIPLDRILVGGPEPQFAPPAAAIHGPRSLPIGFGRDPDVLYIASNVGRDTLGVYGLNVKTGRRTEFVLEDPIFDLGSFSEYPPQSSAIWDRRTGTLAGMRYMGAQLRTIWADRELADAQRRIENLVPGASVAIETWDNARGRFLARVSTRTDPGFFAIHDHLEPGKLRRAFGCAPAISALPRVAATPWSLKRPDGTLLHGSLALPAVPKVKPTPVVVVMRNGLWGRMPADYDPEVRALAQMGYAVLEVSHRGILGLGLNHWEAGRGKLDTVIAVDVLAALDRIAAEAGLDRGKVALWGASFGGTMALRLAHMIPERVACVVAVGPLLDLSASMASSLSDSPRTRQNNEVRRAFFGPTDALLKAWSPASFSAKVTQPTLVVTIENRYPIPDDPAPGVVRRMKAAGNVPEVIKESSAKGWGEMNARISEAAEKFLAKHFPSGNP